jgi:very-short-patch-repair endonuclease
MTERRIRRIRQPILTAAKEHRRQATPAEAHLWAALRGQQMRGLPFRRQPPVERFILDFYCPREKLCVELDGPVHDGQQDYDAARTEALGRLNIRVLRFRNEEVLRNLTSVLQRIEAALDAP